MNTLSKEHQSLLRGLGDVLHSIAGGKSTLTPFQETAILDILADRDTPMMPHVLQSTFLESCESIGHAAFSAPGNTFAFALRNNRKEALCLWDMIYAEPKQIMDTSQILHLSFHDEKLL